MPKIGDKIAYLRPLDYGDRKFEGEVISITPQGVMTVANHAGHWIVRPEQVIERNEDDK